MQSILQDARYALRSLRRNAGFTIVALLTLAIGIGATTAIFSVVNAVLLRPLPFPRPDRLVRIWGGNPTVQLDRAPLSTADVEDFRDRVHGEHGALVDLGGYWFTEGMSGTDLTGQGEPRRLSAAFVTPGFFGTMGVAPLVGRVPRDDEMVRGADDHQVVLSWALWHRLFAGDPSVIGRTLTLGGSSYRVAGVLPESFRYPSPTVDLWIPYSTIPDDAIPHRRGVRTLDVVGRLRAGATVAPARQQMLAIVGSLAATYPVEQGWTDATVVPLATAITGDVRSELLVLLGAVGFVLLVACVNLAGLLLARLPVRARELAVRAALGAGRGRIVRQLLTESLLPALIGGALGALAAPTLTRGIVRLTGSQLPRAETVGTDPRVLCFALVLSLVTGAIFGVIPAVRAARLDLQGTLREGGRGNTGAGQRLRGALVAAEVALAFLLVAGAGLMTRSFLRLMHVDLGFHPEQLVAVNFTIPEDRYPKSADAQEYLRQVLERVRAMPGVVAAGAAKALPLRGDGEQVSLAPDGMSAADADRLGAVSLMHITDGYFRTMGVPLLAGRDFGPEDRAGHPVGLIINHAMAERFFPGVNPVGHTLTTDHIPVIGVVGDIRQTGVTEPAQPAAYIDVFQNLRVKVNLVVRTRDDPAAMLPRLRQAIWSVDPQQTITSSFTMDDALAEAVARPRLLVVLLGVFGALGLLLGALGIYGVLSYLVTQRRREIGVRIALGARPGDVLGMVVRRGLVLTAIGIAAGAAGALVLGRAVRAMLYEVQPTDPVTLLVVTAVLLAAAAIASVLPALRATRVDPAVALRAD